MAKPMMKNQEARVSRPEIGMTPSLADRDWVVRVRSLLSKEVRYPGAIGVKAVQGKLILSGPIFKGEMDRVEQLIKSLPQDVKVQYELSVIEPEEGIRPSSLHENVFAYQPNYFSGKWPMKLRLIAGGASVALGAGLFLKTSRTTRALMALVGISLSLRAITNDSLVNLAGTLVSPVMRLRRSIQIAASAEEVYDFLKTFEHFRQFMSYVQDVEVNDKGGLHWEIRGPLGLSVGWDAILTSMIPNQLISWKSVPGALISNEGVIRIRPVRNRMTRLEVELSYAPPAGALGYAVAHTLGYNPKDKIDEDLRVLKYLLEEKAV